MAKMTLQHSGRMRGRRRQQNATHPSPGHSDSQTKYMATSQTTCGNKPYNTLRPQLRMKTPPLESAIDWLVRFGGAEERYAGPVLVRRSSCCHLRFDSLFHSVSLLRHPSLLLSIILPSNSYSIYTYTVYDWDVWSRRGWPGAVEALRLSRRTFARAVRWPLPACGHIVSHHLSGALVWVLVVVRSSLGLVLCLRYLSCVCPFRVLYAHYLFELHMFIRRLYLEGWQ